MVNATIPPTLIEALGPNRNPAGFIRNRFAPPKPVVWIIPKILEALPPVIRPRMLFVGRPELLRKLAMLLVGTLKFPKLWNKLVPPPGRVPPVMSYWTLPLGIVIGALTCVFSPDEVIGGAAACAKEPSNKIGEPFQFRNIVTRALKKNRKLIFITIEASGGSTVRRSL